MRRDRLALPCCQGARAPLGWLPRVRRSAAYPCVCGAPSRRRRSSPSVGIEKVAARRAQGPPTQRRGLCLSFLQLSMVSCPPRFGRLAAGSLHFRPACARVLLLLLKSINSIYILRANDASSQEASSSSKVVRSGKALIEPLPAKPRSRPSRGWTHRLGIAKLIEVSSRLACGLSYSHRAILAGNKGSDSRLIEGSEIDADVSRTGSGTHAREKSTVEILRSQVLLSGQPQPLSCLLHSLDRFLRIRLN